MPVKHVHLSTPVELALLAEQADATLMKCKHSSGYTVKDGAHMLRHPAERTELVAAARDALNKLMLDLPSTRREFRSEVVGAFPNVGAYASGDPECMWLPYSTEDEYSPIKIWANMTCHQDLASNTAILNKRGVVLMALIIALSERRQISLTCYHATSGSYSGKKPHEASIVSWDVPVAPLVIAQIVTNLAEPAVIREVAYRANDMTTGRSGPYFLHGHNPMSPDPNQARIDLAANPDDIIIAGLHVNDPMLRDPIAWLNDKISTALKGRTE